MKGMTNTWTICVCPEPGCGGWQAEHFAEAVGMWHNHDGRHVDFEPITVVRPEAVAGVLHARGDTFTSRRTRGAFYAAADVVLDVFASTATDEPQDG